MGQAIRIKAGEIELTAELNDSKTAQALAAILPFSGKANRWGDEIYFKTAVSETADQDARTIMEVGELAYWPPGQAFCILFGPTPASNDDRPQMASDSNPIGRVTGDATVLRNVAGGTEVVVELA